ncbi:RNA polymerase sigma factor (sigma-70 family) [Leeuwenhoekiella aestuarii]|uniref:RNA polymerase sigma factor (Sigma-70 family) n=1 Tax=Leeuwenhoekiella aestuarii TaxID=2249426 RepID=A0A4Q0P0S1_9FLAO|nr:sigma-70 family RNA polymerase sigma factor [Leeuwenhoekiella aestuarii]RXG18388.1 RNA polymerase sigma factor (sigma-70 family) [Leeuwenhoekiella aestuarii]RXG19693.1 RNA polymerase sigma factor (sigma-70 family) [Leeuwenhoekiella aestuarii]
MKRFQLDTHYDAFKKGCPHAFEAIYRQYHRSVYWMGRSILKDVYAVENILQDTFLILWEKRDRIQSPEHLHAFLHFVMKSECIYQYSKPRNAFQRNLSRLDYFENYQDYLGGYEGNEEAAHLQRQEADQQALDQIQKVLPLLGSERKLLVELCLKYGFQYKAIAQAMGTSTAKTSIEVKGAIEDIKNIITNGSTLEAEATPIRALKAPGNMTREQEKVLQLRTEKRYSFAAISKELNLSLKEVHQEFMAAYKRVQLKHDQQQSA